MGKRAQGKAAASKNAASNVCRINVITMGCSKNLVDSEVLLGQLRIGKFEVFHDADGKNFDAVIINTCGFIHDAKQESIDMILEYADAKLRGEIGKLYVMGCLSERYMKELEKEIPEADRYFGKFDLKAIITELNAAFYPEYIYERMITTPSHYAYLKISEGCNRTCAFCAIPQMTGRYKSVPAENLIEEAGYLVTNGVRELLLIAQDLSFYGKDIYGKNQLTDLVERISEIDDLEWIRLHYLYPSGIPEDLADLIRNNPKVCRYLDIPLQHISNRVLKRMCRKVSRAETESLIRRFRERIPGVALRTTVMAGFPGETDSDFEELKQFIKESRFERLGVFTYSHEEGTLACRKLNDDVPEEVKQSRAEELMEIQKEISCELNRQRTGDTYKVIIDRREGDQFIGRTEFDSPEVDGEVYVTAARELQTGRFYQVEITGAGEYDLQGTALF
jgi:ribosomal protein S12 methylthiotransferase